MSDRNLLSRREVIALFGAGAVTSQVMGKQQQLSPESGNIVGGADNMPAPYKVGEGTYKGPLSVRSEVPQEDGITFIQTDAGSGNDQFALHHYNGGWEGRGFNGPSVQTEEGPTKILNASPGEVQSKIDEGSKSSLARVRLNSSETYDPGSPWVIKKGVILDYNGAKVVPSSDYDIHHMHPGGRVVNPEVDWSSLTTYTSSAFVFNPSFNGDYNANIDNIETYIEGGRIEGNYPDTAGTVFKLLTPSSLSDPDITGNNLVRGTSVVHTSVALDMRSEAGNLDHNRFDMQAVSVGKGIHTHGGGGALDANVVEGFVGPLAGESTHLWYHEHGNSNSFIGSLSNSQDFGTAVWEIASGAGARNQIQTSVRVTDTHILDNEGDPTNVVVSPGYNFITSEANATYALASRSATIGATAHALTDRGTVNGTNAVGVGPSVTSDSNQSTAVGQGAAAQGDFAVALGNADATAAEAVAIGLGVSNSVNKTTALKGNLKVNRTFVDSANTTSSTTNREDEVIGVDTGSAAVTVTLDSSSAGDEGHRIRIKDEGQNAGTNNITVDTAGSETIDGASSVTLSTDGAVLVLYSDGNDWQILKQGAP